MILHMNKKRLLFFILGIVLGACMFVCGEYDDSPGGQLLGFVAVAFGIVGVIQNMRKKI